MFKTFIISTDHYIQAHEVLMASLPIFPAGTVEAFDRVVPFLIVAINQLRAGHDIGENTEQLVKDSLYAIVDDAVKDNFKRIRERT